MHEHMHTCMHAYIHAALHAYIHAFTHTGRRTDTQTYMHACMHACLHTCMHACLHTCIHTHMHAYMHTCRYVDTCAYIHIGPLCLCLHIEKLTPGSPLKAGSPPMGSLETTQQLSFGRIDEMNVAFPASLPKGAYSRCRLPAKLSRLK